MFTAILTPVLTVPENCCTCGVDPALGAMHLVYQGPEKTSPHLLLRAQDQQLDAEHDQLPFGSTATFSCNCQETETCMVRACHTPRQPLQNHPSGYLGGWATPWSAEEMLDGQHQRVDIPAYARTAHNGLLQKRLEEDLCCIVLHVPPPPYNDPIGQGTELN